MRNLIRLFTGVAVAALITLAPGHVRAQGVTSSAIGGTVTDASGQPVVGAEVSAVHTPSGTVYSTITRSGGSYTIPNVRVGGPYSVTVKSSSGSKRLNGVNVELSQTQRADLQVGAAPAAAAASSGSTGGSDDPSRVIVESTAVDDEIFAPNRTGTNTIINRSTIDDLPTISRSLQDYARLTPQAQLTSTGGISIAGQNNRFNTVTIDGSTSNDAFGLSASGVLTDRAEPISLDAIEQFRIDIAPYDVRKSNFTGGSIDAVTRAGTNRWEGSIYGFYRDADMIGRIRFFTNPGVPAALRGTVQPPLTGFEEYTYGARLGFPIIKDKLFIFVLGESKRRTEPTLGTIGGAAATFLGNLTTGQAALDLAQSRYGYAAGTFDTVLDQVNDDKVTVRLDWNINKDHRLTLRYNYIDAYYTDGTTRTASTFTATSRAFERTYNLNSYVAQLLSTWSPNLNTEARVTYNRTRFKRNPGTPFPEVSVNTGNNNFIVFGNERSSQQNSLDQDVVESVLNATYVLGKHTLTMGVGVDNYAFSNLFIQDAFGTYSFDSLADFQNGAPSRYRISYSTIPGTRAPLAQFSYYNVSFFLQDEWKLTPRLNIIAGLRFDRPIYNSTPLYNATFENRFGRRTDRLPDEEFAVAPRLGFNWDVMGDQSFQVRGGVGVFTGRSPGVWLSNQFSNTGVDIARVDRTFAAGTRPANFFSPDPGNQPLPGPGSVLGNVPNSSIALTDANFKFPQVMRANLAVEKKLPFGFVLGIEGIFTKDIEAVAFNDLNLVRNTNLAGNPNGILPDGRLTYVRRADAPEFSSVILMKSVSKGSNYSGTISLERPRPKDGGLAFRTAYTYTRAFNVTDGTSSVASSNFINRAIYNDPNNDNSGRSYYEIRHRIQASIDYQFELRKGWQTTIGLYYEGRSGFPYAYVYSNDINGDGSTSNDLVYVPRDYSNSASSDVLFGTLAGGTSTTTAGGSTIRTGATTFTPNNTAAAAFADLVNRNPLLRDAKGRVLARNEGTNPWINRIDLRISQRIPVPLKGQLDFTFDILNLGNLLGRKFGLYRTWGSNNVFPNPSLVTYAGTTVQNGVTKPVYTYSVGAGELSVPNGNLAIDSRWQIQTGLRYSF